MTPALPAHGLPVRWFAGGRRAAKHAAVAVVHGLDALRRTPEPLGSGFSAGRSGIRDLRPPLDHGSNPSPKIRLKNSVNDIGGRPSKRSSLMTFPVAPPTTRSVESP